ncbi:MAG: dienelactone hydrolase family protein [Acidimicrobiales bacterium]
MVDTRTETITVDDGVSFDAFVALPDAGAGPGVLVIQEIFGVNLYIQQVCKRLAGLGYVALAPDAFHRQGGGFAVDRTGPGGRRGVAKASKRRPGWQTWATPCRTCAPCPRWAAPRWA